MSTPTVIEIQKGSQVEPTRRIVLGSNMTLDQTSDGVTEIDSSSGVTAHNILSATHDTTVGSEATGDTIYRNASSQWTRLAIGSLHQVLKSEGSPLLPTWGTVDWSELTGTQPAPPTHDIDSAHDGGPLSVGKGGTGRSTLTSGYVLRGNTTSAITMTDPFDLPVAYKGSVDPSGAAGVLWWNTSSGVNRLQRATGGGNEDVPALPTTHTHVKADITDTPWAWSDVSKTGSNLTDLATRLHSSLQSIGIDDHHARDHDIDGSTHTASGLTTGHFMKATGTTTFAFAAHGLTYSDVGAAASSHTHATSDITSGWPWTVSEGGTGATSFTSGYVLVGNTTGAIQAKSADDLGVVYKGPIDPGVVEGQLWWDTTTGENILKRYTGSVWEDVPAAVGSHTHVKADITDTPWAWTDVSKTGSSLADLATRNHSDLQNVSADQHHNQQHDIDGSDHTGTLGVAKGGTGRSTLTSGYVLRGNTTSAITMTDPFDLPITYKGSVDPSAAAGVLWWNTSSGVNRLQRATGSGNEDVPALPTDHTHTKSDITDTPWGKSDIPSATAYEDEANTFVANQLIQKATPYLTLDASSGNAVYQFKEATVVRSAMLYHATNNQWTLQTTNATDTLISRIRVDGESNDYVFRWGASPTTEMSYPFRVYGGGMQVQTDTDEWLGLEVVHNNDASGNWCGMGVTTHGANSVPLVWLLKARGVYGTPAVPQAGDLLGRFDYGGWVSGEGYGAVGASIRATINDDYGNWASGDTPADLSFWTVPEGSATELERLTIFAGGSWGGYIYASDDAYMGLEISTTASTGSGSELGLTTKGSGSSGFWFYRTLGSDGSESAVTQNAWLGYMDWIGYATATENWEKGARIYAKATENWGASAGGATLIMQTTATGARDTLVDRLTIDGSGYVVINGQLKWGGGSFLSSSSNLVMISAANTYGDYEQLIYADGGVTKGWAVESNESGTIGPLSTDSGYFRWTGWAKPDATANVQVDWKAYVDVTSTSGASTWKLQERTNAASFETYFQITSSGAASILAPSGSAPELNVGPATGSNVSAYVDIESSGGTGSPFLRFFGRPAVNVICGDDSANHVFNFYTGFSNNRTYDASIRIFGSASSSWGTFLQLTHDGDKGIIESDTNIIQIGTSTNRTLTYTSVYNIGTTSGTTDVDFEDGAQQRLTLGGNHTLTITNGGSSLVEGMFMTLIIQQGATPYTPTFAVEGSGTVDWGDDSAPGVGTANKDDVYQILAVSASEVFMWKAGTGFTYP